MFHFGFPSEKLDHDISPPPRSKDRYHKLLYIGSGTDPIPLPVAKSAIFVDTLNDKRHTPPVNGVEKCNEPQCIIEFLIEKAQDLYVILESPIVKWYYLNHRPVAQVTFQWGEMPHLTQYGNKTVLTYLFGTKDFEMGTRQTLKRFSNQVDIIWICGYGPSVESFKHIDLKKVDMAVGYTHLYLPNALKHCRNYYYVEQFKCADMFLRKIYKKGFSRHFPKDFSFKDMRFLLACTISSHGLTYDQFKKECDVFNNLNNPFKYLKYCSEDDIYKVYTDPTLVKYRCCEDCLYNAKPDPNGWTVLHVAAEQGDLEMIKILAKKDLPINKSDNLGNTPLSLAKHYSHVDVLNYFENYCKIQNWNSEQYYYY